MTVGQTLTEARSQAGLTVDELSERTRIRGTVIRSIEQDDYEACGGDLYVRGYVRALAGAVGIDAQPLIREYERGRLGQAGEYASGPTGRHARGNASAPPTAFDLPAVPAAPIGQVDASATRFDLPPVSSDPAATAFDLPAVPPVPPAMVPPAAALPPGSADTRFDLPAVTDDPMAAGYVPWPQGEPAQWPEPGSGRPGDATAAILALGQDPAAPPAFPAPPGVMPYSTGPFSTGPISTGPIRTGPTDAGPISTRPSDAARKNRRTVIAAAVAFVVLLAVGILGVHLATGGKPAAGAAGNSAPPVSASSAAAQSSAAPAASAAASASAAQAAGAPVTVLPVAAAQAFGPDGLADGDDPGNAKDAISAGASQPWSTQWYATPQFGMLKHGTGLLLDLGGTVTVSGVVIDLSKYQGADLEIRAGNGTAPQDLVVAATASDVGGVVRLTLPRPATARYLLIWFTQLPSDGAGHYAETVSAVQVTGRR